MTYEHFCDQCRKAVHPPCNTEGVPTVAEAWCHNCVNNVPFYSLREIDAITLDEDRGRGLATPEWPSPCFPTGAPRQPTRARSNALILEHPEDFEYREEPEPTIDFRDIEEGSEFWKSIDTYGVPPAVIDLTDTESVDIHQTDYDDLNKQAGEKRKASNNNEPQRAWAATWYLWKTKEEFDAMWLKDAATGLPFACTSSDEFKRFWNNSSISYIIAGKETCPTTGRLHLQIALYAKGKLRFSTLQKLMPGARITPCRKPFQANINYCRKEKNFAEKGVRPLTKQEGAMARLHLLEDMLSTPLRSVEEYDLVFDSCKALCREALDLVCDVMSYNNNKY